MSDQNDGHQSFMSTASNGHDSFQGNRETIAEPKTQQQDGRRRPSTASVSSRRRRRSSLLEKQRREEEEKELERKKMEEKRLEENGKIASAVFSTLGGQTNAKLTKSLKQLPSVLVEEGGEEDGHNDSTTNTNGEKEIFRLQQEVTKYGVMIEEKQEEMRTLNRRIRMRKEEVLRYRKRVGGAEAVRENDTIVHRTERIIENRLDDAYKKAMSANAKNEKLKEKINELRRELLRHNGQVRALRKKLKLRKLAVLKEEEEIQRLKQETKKHRTEVKEIEQRAEEKRLEMEETYRKLREEDKEIDSWGDDLSTQMAKFVPKQRPRTPKARTPKGSSSNKGHTSSSTAVGSKSNNITGSFIDALDEFDFSPPASPSKRSGSTRVLSKAEESMLKASVLRSKWSVVFDRVLRQKATEGAESYKEAFELIAQNEGFRTLDEFVKNFKGIEDDNFQRFNFIADTETTCEDLARELMEAREAVSEAKEKFEMDDVARKKILSGILKSIQDTSRKCQYYEDRMIILKHSLEKFSAGIYSLYDVIQPTLSRERPNGATVSVLTQRIDTGLNVQDCKLENIMLYMGLIEQRVDELLGRLAINLRMQQKRTKKTTPSPHLFTSPKMKQQQAEVPALAQQLIESLKTSYGPQVPKNSVSACYKRLELPNMTETSPSMTATDIIPLNSGRSDTKPVHFEQLTQEVQRRFSLTLSSSFKLNRNRVHVQEN